MKKYLLGGYLIVAKEMGAYSLLAMQAACTKCKQYVMVFDNTTDGWDGLFFLDDLTDNTDGCDIVSMPSQRDKINNLTGFQCAKCRLNNFSIGLEIETLDKAEILEFEEEYPEKHWQDAYTNIMVHLICQECGKAYGGIIDYETA